MFSRVRFVQRLLVAVISLSGALSCAGPNGFGRAPDVSNLEIENWLELRSENFILYSRGPAENLEIFALDLARYIAVVERLVNAPPPNQLAQLFFVEGRAEALLIPHPGVGGYVDYSLSGFSSFMRGSSHNAGYRNLLLHEFTHYLNLRGSELRYPNWYTEGFAEFLGSTRARDDVMEIGSAPPQNLLRLEYRRLRKEKIDLEEIFSFERDGKRRDPRDFYPISWAVVHYLNSHADRRRRMVSMLKHQGAGMHWKRAYDRSFTEPIEILAAKVDRHTEILSGGTPSAVTYLPLESLDVRDSWEIREIPPPEILRLLGELALRGVVYLDGGTNAGKRLAEALFARAVELDPKDSKARAGLAAALAAQSKSDEAETHLAVFREDPEPSVEAIVHAGDAVRWQTISLTEERDKAEKERLYSTAIQLYRRALESQPNNAFALAGLGYSQFGNGDFEAARESLASAENVGEWDANLMLMQGRVEQRLGFPAEATAFWNEVLRRGTEDEVKRAAALLDEARSKK